MMKLFALLAGLSFLACTDTGAAAGARQEQTSKAGATDQASYVDLSPSEFAAKMKAPNTLVLDVRTPSEIARGKIDGAVELDYRAADFAERLAELGTDQTILVYCASGGRSSSTAEMLVANGAQKVFNLRGGYRAWQQQ